MPEYREGGGPARNHLLTECNEPVDKGLQVMLAFRQHLGSAEARQVWRDDADVTTQVRDDWFQAVMIPAETMHEQQHGIGVGGPILPVLRHGAKNTDLGLPLGNRRQGAGVGGLRIHRGQSTVGWGWRRRNGGGEPYSGGVTDVTEALPDWAAPLAVFDLETTGVDVRTARIVTAHLGVLDADGGVTAAWNWLADPGVEIPPAAAAVHGISTERARAEGRPAAEVVAEILDRLRGLQADGLAVVIYNAPYDLTILREEALRYGLEPLGEPMAIIDPLVIDKAVDRYRRGKRQLGVTAEHYGVPLTDAHEASADAIAAGRIAQALARRFPAELHLPIAELQARQAQWHDDQAANFEAYMRAQRDPSFRAARGWPLR